MKVLPKEEIFNSFFTYACFFAFLMEVRHFFKFLGIKWVNRRKTEETTLLFLNFYFLFQSEKIDLLKATDAAKSGGEMIKIKLNILQITFHRNFGCNIYLQKLPIPLASAFIYLFLFSLRFFSACAFMRELLVNCSLKSLALL